MDKRYEINVDPTLIEVFNEMCDEKRIRFLVCPVPVSTDEICMREVVVWSLIRHRNRRNFKNLTQEYLAKFLGIHVRSVSKCVKNLRKAKLLDDKKLIVLDRPDFWRKFERKDNVGRTTFKPWFFRFPIPSKECPVSLEALVFLGFLISFPNDQGKKSLHRVLGFHRQTIHDYLPVIGPSGTEGAVEREWFSWRAKKPALTADEQFDIWFRTQGIDYNQKAQLSSLRADLADDAKFYAICKYARNSNDRGPGKWLAWARYNLNQALKSKQDGERLKALYAPDDAEDSPEPESKTTQEILAELKKVEPKKVPTAVVPTEPIKPVMPVQTPVNNARTMTAAELLASLRDSDDE